MVKIYQKIFPAVKNAGFTLIELLVVVLIIGILAAVAVPQYQKAVLKAQWSEIYQAERTIAKAQEAYYMANGEYTRDFNDLDVTFPGISKMHSNNFTTDHFRGVLYGGGEGIYAMFHRLKDGSVDTSLALVTYYALNSPQCRAQNKEGDAICLWLTGGATPSKFGKENRYYFNSKK